MGISIQNQSRNPLGAAAEFIGSGTRAIVETKLKFSVFTPDRNGAALKRLWTLLQAPTITDNDTTVQAVKKAAFAFFIMLPAAHFIKDALDHTGLINLETSATLKESLIYLGKSFAYIFIVVTIIDYLLPPEGAKKAQETLEVQPKPKRNQLTLDARYTGPRI